MALAQKVIRMDDHRSDGPQLEDGFVRIANELFDAVLSKLSSYRHTKIVLAIIRKTYGYGKKEDDITISQLAEITGIHRNNVGSALKDLESMRIINPVRAGRHGLVIGINKHHHDWGSDVVKARGPGKKAINLIGEEESNQNVASTQSKRLKSAIKTIETSNQNVAHNRQPQKTTPKDNPKRERAAAQPAAVTTLLPAAAAATAAPEIETALQAACRETWRAYSDAYAVRYGVAPVRNQKVSSQVKSFVRRLGYEESPQVAAWFVRHPGSYYAGRMHDFGCLLTDAEKLRTEWATGRVMTAGKARQSDRAGTTMAALAEVLAEQGETL